MKLNDIISDTTKERECSKQLLSYLSLLFHTTSVRTRTPYPNRGGKSPHFCKAMPKKASDILFASEKGLDAETNATTPLHHDSRTNTQAEHLV